MDKRPFFVNFWSICMYAFLGTLLSTIVIAVMIIIVAAINIGHPFSSVDAFCFGSIISATDPVTVLAVFQVSKLQCEGVVMRPCVACGVRFAVAISGFLLVDDGFS